MTPIDRGITGSLFGERRFPCFVPVPTISAAISTPSRSLSATRRTASREIDMAHSERPHPSRRELLRTASLALIAGSLSRNAWGQTTAPLKIGIIGSGHIGSTIGSLWVKAGHPVMFSSRHPEELAPLVRQLGALAKSGSVADAIAFGVVVFIAVPYGAYPQIGKDYGSLLAGKVVLDAGNAVARRDGDITNEGNEEGIGITSA